MQNRYVRFTLIGVLVFQNAFAAEVDSVTPRKIKLDNSIETINEIINQRIQQGVQKANAKPGYVDDIVDIHDLVNDEEERHCDEEALYAELRKAIFQSLTASWGLKGYDLDMQLRDLLTRQSYSLLLNDSIYRDIDYIEGFSMKLKQLSDVVNINGYLVGLDKIGHFFAQGWQYFDMTQHDGKTLEKAMEWGRDKETGMFGFSTTGIFSYADLAANLNGWRFWNRILLRSDDPLKGPVANLFNSPYVTCEIQIIDSIRNWKLMRAWEINTRFDLSDYIDGAWDEANNCNSYADPMIEDKVASRISGVDPDFTCPLNPEHCEDAQDRYGYYAKYVLHPSCLTIGVD